MGCGNKLFEVMGIAGIFQARGFLKFSGVKVDSEHVLFDTVEIKGAVEGQGKLNGAGKKYRYPGPGVSVALTNIRRSIIISEA